MFNLEKLKAFFEGKKIASTIGVKGDGTVMLTADQAAAAESLAGELETANAALEGVRTELATANENMNAAQSEIAQLRTNIDALNNTINEINTELGVEENGSAIEAIRALGKQPGSMGAGITKKKDEIGEDKNSKFRTSFDEEADAMMAELGIGSK